MRKSSRATLVAVSLGAFGCSGDDQTGDKRAPQDEYEAELFSTTRVLDEDVMASLTAYDDDGTLHFSGTPEALADLARHDVLVGDVSDASPKGFLRWVKAVDSDADGLVITTGAAPIQMAFRKLHVKLTRHIDDLGADDVAWNDRTSRLLSTGSKWQSKDIDFFAMNGDGDETTEDDQVHVTGHLAGGFDYDFGLDVDWDDVYEVPGEFLDCLDSAFSGCSVEDLLPEAKVGFGVDVGADATLAMQGVAFLPYKAPYTLGVAKLPKFKLGILWFFPEVEVKATVSGNASSQFSFELGAHASAGMGVSFSSKHGSKVTPPHADFDFGAPHVDATLQAGGRVEVGPELHVRLWDVAGPYAGLSAFAELTANRDQSPCYELYAGIGSNFGFDIRTPDLPVIGSVSVADWSKSYELYNELADSGDCEPLPGGDAPSPTAGEPSAAAFTDPSFTPWSYTYSAAVDGHPYEGPGAQIEWLDVTPTIDGRFVVTGSDTKALLKLSPDGAVVWSKRYLGPVDFYEGSLTPELLISNVLNLGDGTMAVIGHPYTVMKLEADGSVLWAEQFDVVSRETTIRLTRIVPAPAGGFFVGGTSGTDRIYGQKVDAWLMRLDANGAVLWSKRWGNPDDGETLRTLVGLEDGVIAAGATWVPDVSRWRAWTARFDADGELSWARVYDARPCGSEYESSAFVTDGLLAKDGDVVFTGNIEDATDYTLVFKLKPDGTLAWSASDRSVRDADIGPRPSRIVELPTSGYLLTGTLDYSEDGTYEDIQDDLLLAATDSVGRLLWMNRYGGRRTENGVLRRSDTYAGATLTQDGGAFVVGYTDTLTPEGNGLWAMKVPAKDGRIEFDSASAAVTGAVDFIPGNNCFTDSDWSADPADYDEPAHSLDVTVEDIDVERYSQ